MADDEEKKQDESKQEKSQETGIDNDKPDFPELEKIRSYVILERKDKKKKEIEKVEVEI